MATQLQMLSAELATVTAQTGLFAVAVHARPRFSSSGALWRQGIVVTAAHAVRQEEDTTVTLPDGNTVPATLAGSDAGTDLAILRVNWNGSALQMDSMPAPGDLALTIGRSKDSGVNVTMGIISAVSGAWRTWRGASLDHYIRLDMTLYPNTSGCLVTDIEGEAIGIATPALSRIAGAFWPYSAGRGTDGPHGHVRF